MKPFCFKTVVIFVLSFCLASLVSCTSSISDNKLNCDCLPNQVNRIVGGQYVQPHEYPWQASLGLRLSDIYTAHLCGATILNSNWVLTAAHCAKATTNVSDLFVGYGDNNLKVMTTHRRVQVSEAVVHPTYDETKSNSVGDIALLRLASPLRLGYTAKPGCLYPSLNLLNKHLEQDKGLEVVATGWGSVNQTYRYIWGGPLRGARIQPLLKKAKFDALSSAQKSECKNRKDLLCITPHVPGDSPCNGDSGGPLNYVVSLKEEIEIEQENRAKNQNEKNNSTNTEKPSGADGDNSIDGTSNSSAVYFNFNEEELNDQMTFHKEPVRRMAVLGVTSFGAGVIKFPNLVRVYFCTGDVAYTKASFYNDWIQETIGKENLCYV